MDRASQIRMPSWSRGRIALVGDAGAAPSLLAGQGSALAMIESYVLAYELHEAHGDHRAAFAGYEQRLAQLVRGKQDAATRMGAAFAPRNRMQLLARNAAWRRTTSGRRLRRSPGGRPRRRADPLSMRSCPLTAVCAPPPVISTTTGQRTAGGDPPRRPRSTDHHRGQPHQRRDLAPQKGLVGLSRALSSNALRR